MLSLLWSVSLGVHLGVRGHVDVSSGIRLGLGWHGVSLPALVSCLAVL